LKLPIVTYHAIGAGPPPVWTSPADFEAQLEAFAAAGYRTVPLTSLLPPHGQPSSMRDDALVITFDDGYTSFRDEAWPRLRRLGYSATVFLIADRCGDSTCWPGQPPGLPTARLLGWDDISDLASEGCEFGAHGRSHCPLVGLSSERLEDEVLGSKMRIAAETGVTPGVFAYPYGATNGEVLGAVRRHFCGAVGTRLGLVTERADRFLLPRIDSYYLTPSLIRSLRSDSSSRYLRVRQWLRTVRRLVRPDWRPTKPKGPNVV